LEKKINSILSGIMLGKQKNRKKTGAFDSPDLEPDFVPIDIAKIKPFAIGQRVSNSEVPKSFHTGETNLYFAEAEEINHAIGRLMPKIDTSDFANNHNCQMVFLKAVNTVRRICGTQLGQTTDQLYRELLKAHLIT